MQDQWQLINVASIRCVDHRVRGNVTHMRNLALEPSAQWLLASTHNDVWLDTARTQFSHAVLRRLCLLFAAWANERHQGHVQVTDIVTASFITELTDGLQEGQNLDVTNGSAHFSNHNICVFSGDAPDTTLDFVGDVRNDLNSLAEVITTSFSSQNSLVDTAGRRI